MRNVTKVALIINGIEKPLEYFVKLKNLADQIKPDRPNSSLINQFESISTPIIIQIFPPKMHKEIMKRKIDSALERLPVGRQGMGVTGKFL